MSQYLVATFAAAPENQEPIIALLTMEGYEAFEQEDCAIKAYIPANDFQPEALEQTLAMFGEPVYDVQPLPDQNWNAEWEANYPPVAIPPHCFIYPSFYELSAEEKQAYRHCLQIQPQMSFGTGHHETTRLMIQLLSEISVQNLSGLDLGCGTGVLGAYALLEGARSVAFVDIDPICVENTEQNLQLNHLDAQRYTLALGDVQAAQGQVFDFALANIQRNVLLEIAPSLSAAVRKGGSLLLSGFFEADVPDLLAAYEPFGMVFQKSVTENNWLALHLTRL